MKYFLIALILAGAAFAMNQMGFLGTPLDLKTMEITVPSETMTPTPEDNDPSVDPEAPIESEAPATP